MSSSSIIQGVWPLSFPWRCVDPFIFCVYHLDQFPAGDGKLAPKADLSGRNIGQDFDGIAGWNMYHGDRVPGFPGHPHRGFETVTVTRQGLLDHSDSLGGSARYGQGDTQWMTAGAGIVHSEMFPLVNTASGNPTELFQIWLNLPPENKMVKPHFAMLWAPKIPKLEKSGQYQLTLIAGSLQGQTPPPPPPNSWAADPKNEVAIWTLRLEEGATFTLPAASKGLSRTLYFFAGAKAEVSDKSLASASMISLDSSQDCQVKAIKGPCQFLMLQGKPILAPVAQYGPFVMNREVELQQAVEDYRRTRFGGWPWPSDDPTHGNKPERFTKFPDGKIEKPPV